MKPNNNETKIIFEKLKQIVYNKKSEDLPVMDFSEELRPIADVSNFLASCVEEINALAKDLSDGNITKTALSKTNYLSGQFKELQSKLLNISWQAKQIQSGDYEQTLDYFGDISEAFNNMTKTLKTREAELNSQIEENKTVSENLLQLFSSMKTLLDNISEKVYVTDCCTKKFIYMNRAAKQNLEHYGDCLLNNNCALFNHINAYGIDEEDGSLHSYEFYCKNSDSWHGVKSSKINWAGNVSAYVHVEKDITNAKEKENLEKIAFKDALTGAFNRRYGIVTLNYFYKAKVPTAICYFDLDGLKSVNDQYGHGEGDKFIKTIAGIMSSSLRKDDVFCRFGGDEFVIILKYATPVSPKKVVNKIYNRINDLNKITDKPYKYLFSAGTAYTDFSDDMTVEELIKQADSRMYQHKKSRKSVRNN